MDTAGENPRGVHAARLLAGRKDFTLSSLQTAAYDPYLPAFARLIPTLVMAFDKLSASNPLKTKLSEPMNVLRGWDYRWSADSVATTVAVFWGEALWDRATEDSDDEQMSVYDRMATRMTDETRLEALSTACERLTKDFGTWRTGWGEINRFQRLNDDIEPHFTDAGVSIPVPFTSSQWGSLASFGARRNDGSKRLYGTKGNSFVAVVEFGERVRAMAVTAGGESGDPTSPHFNDQAIRYARGELREVYFYPDQLTGHTERQYHPGD
jgi:acyl-homoserine-lactone acylase